MATRTEPAVSADTPIEDDVDVEQDNVRLADSRDLPKAAPRRWS